MPSMEKVLNLLDEIEEKANAILAHTSVEKAALHDQLNKDMEKLDREMEEKTKNQLDELRQKMNKEITNETKLLVESCNKQLEELEHTFQKNHDKLVDVIFQKIIEE